MSESFIWLPLSPNPFVHTQVFCYLQNLNFLVCKLWIFSPYQIHQKVFDLSHLSITQASLLLILHGRPSAPVKSTYSLLRLLSLAWSKHTVSNICMWGSSEWICEPPGMSLLCSSRAVVANLWHTVYVIERSRGSGIVSYTLWYACEASSLIANVSLRFDPMSFTSVKALSVRWDGC